MSAPEGLSIPRKVWTRAEVNRLSWDGFSLELVDGELIDKMGKKPPHTFWLGELRDWLIAHFGGDRVRSEAPIDVAPQDNPTNEPEPDLSVTYQSRRELRGANPQPGGLRLVVEISDSTYEYDRAIKAALYARAGICEYWVLDIRKADAPRLIVHLYSAGQYVASAFGPNDEIKVLDGLNLKLSDFL